MTISTQERLAIITFAKENGIGTDTNHGFQNFSKNVVNKNAIKLIFRNRQQVEAYEAYIKNINANKSSSIISRYASGGTGEEYDQSFSFEDCVGPDADIVCYMVGETRDVTKRDALSQEFNRVNFVKRIDANNILVDIGAGLQVGTAEKTMEEDKTIEANFKASSLIPYPRLWALLANAGHGDGGNETAVSGQVESLTITGPDGVTRTLSYDHPKFGGDKFDIIKGAHFGMFGPVIHGEIKCRPAVKMKSTIISTNLFSFMKMAEEGIFSKYFAVNMIYMPTYRDDELEATCEENVDVVIWELLKEEELLIETKNKDRNNTPLMTHIEQESSVRANDDLHIPELMNAYPHLAVYILRMIAAIEIGKGATVSVGPASVKAHYQTGFPAPKAPNTLDDVDMLFPTSSKGVPEMIAALKFSVRRLLEIHKATGQTPLKVAMYLRLFDQLTVKHPGLATSAFKKGDKVCALDMVSYASSPGWKEYYTEIMTTLINTYFAKAHPGKKLFIDGKFPTYDYIEKAFGENYDEYIAVLREYYVECGVPLEKSPYLNLYMKRILAKGLGLSLEEINREEKISTPLLEEKNFDFHQIKVGVEEFTKFVHAHLQRNPSSINAAHLHKEMQKVSNDIKPLLSRKNSFTPPDNKTRQPEDIQLIEKKKEEGTSCCASMCKMQ